MVELKDWADLESRLIEAEKRLSENTPPRTVVPTIEGAVSSVPDRELAQPQLQMQQPSANEVGLRIPILPQKTKKKDGVDNAGADWYHLPRTNLTEETKRDFQLLRMRDVLANGKQFFKKDNSRKLIPDYSAMGTMIEGPTDGVNGRLTRKERKRTIVEEVLSSGDALDKYKRKYGTIQEKKASGRKGHYKKLVARRRRNG